MATIPMTIITTILIFIAAGNGNSTNTRGSTSIEQHFLSTEVQPSNICCVNLCNNFIQHHTTSLEVALPTLTISQQVSVVRTADAISPRRQQ